MPVEKLLLAKFAKNEIALGCPKNDFSALLNIFYPPNFRCFEENGVFQQTQAIAAI